MEAPVSERRSSMNTQQTAVEQKATPYPATKPGTGDSSGNGGGAGGNGSLPVPQQPDGAAEQKLKSERVQEELKAMAGWALAREEQAVENVKTFATPELAGLYGAFAIQSAAATGNAVTVNLSGNQVCVTVFGQEIDGCLGELSLPVLAFARQL